VRPEDVVAQRRALGWSRQRLADECGVTVHIAWRFENRITAGADDALLRRVLGNGTEPEPEEHPEDAEWTGETIDTEQWRGLRKGDRVILLSRDLSEKEKGTYAFMRYFKSVTQEYVDLSSNRGVRSVLPERIRAADGGAL
jgi:hypothetical protein